MSFGRPHKRERRSLRNGQSYRELGGHYFDRLNTERLTRYHTKRLAALGYTVTLAKVAA